MSSPRAPSLLLLMLVQFSCAPSTGAVNAPPDAARALDDAGTAPDDASTSDASTPAPLRDWAAAPAIVELDTAADVFALGDIHGDYDRLITLLVGTRLLQRVPAAPESPSWSGGGAVLVITGDLIDKWTQSLKVLAFVQALRDSAAAAGGRVVVLCGNHEAEFLAEPNNSKAAPFDAELKAAGIAPADVASGLHPLGRYLRALPFAARINDSFFAHAGNTAGKSLAQLDAALRQGVDAQGFTSPVLLAADSLLEAKLSPPWWETGAAPATVLGGYAAALGVKRLVIGHQPEKITFQDGTSRSKGTLAGKYGLIFLIDVGMSRGVDDSVGAVLRIRGGMVSALYGDGSAVQLFP